MIYLVLFFGLILRLISLNQSLWLDEATTALVSQMSLTDFFTKFMPNDFHPPLYYLFMKLWTNFFGYSEIVLRMPSVLFSLATGYVVYLIGGAWAAVFFLFNPLIVYYSQEARMYMMGAFFVTLSYFALWTGRKKLYIFAVVLALHTHYFTILILLAQIVAKLPVCKFKIGNLLKIGNWKLEIFAPFFYRAKYLISSSIIER